MAATSTSIYTSTAYEQLVALVGGAAACLVAFAAARVWPPVLAIVMSACIVLLGIAVRPRFFRHWGVRLLAWRGIDPGPLLRAPTDRGRPLQPTRLARDRTRRLAAAARAASEDIPGIAWVTGVYAFSWMVGLPDPAAYPEASARAKASSSP